MANLIPNSYCQLKSVNIINIEDDQLILDRILEIINGTEPILNVLKVNSMTDGSRIIAIESSALQLTRCRYVWLWCEVETHTITTIKQSSELIIYPTGSLSDDIISYTQRVMQISNELKKEFEGKELKITSEYPTFENETGTGEIVLTIPLLVSILLTRWYHEKDENLVSVAKLMLCNINQLDWF